MKVDFLHRTVYDFLLTPIVKVTLVAPDTNAFNASLTLLKAIVSKIKGFRMPNVKLAHKALQALLEEALCYVLRVEF
jgi:hypothetical protein